MCASLEDAVLNWLLARLREPSSWRGIVWLLTVFGLAIKPGQAEAIVTAGMALAGLLGVFLSDETRSSAVGHDSTGPAGNFAASGADSVRADLPDIDLVGKPLGNANRNTSVDAGLDHQRVGSTRPGDRMRVPVSSEDSTRPYKSAADLGIGINCVWRY